MVSKLSLHDCTGVNLCLAVQANWRLLCPVVPASNFCEQRRAGHKLDQETKGCSRITVAANISLINMGDRKERPDLEKEGPGCIYGTGTFYTPLVGPAPGFDDPHPWLRSQIKRTKFYMVQKRPRALDTEGIVAVMVDILHKVAPGTEPEEHTNARREKCGAEALRSG